MMDMTEAEALHHVDSIGTAFANDVCDGEDSEVLYEGVSVDQPMVGPNQTKFLTYYATMEDGTEVTYRWILTLFSRKVENSADDN